MKFKVGDKVRVTKKSLNRFNQIGIIEFIDINGVPFKVRFSDGSSYWFLESDLTPFKRTIDDVQKGDLIRNKYNERRVVEVLGDIVFLCFLKNDEILFFYTKKTLKKEGYTLVQPQDTYEFEGKEYDLEQVREAIEGLEEVE